MVVPHRPEHHMVHTPHHATNSPPRSHYSASLSQRHRQHHSTLHPHRRRRRPSLWDVRTPQYYTPPPPTANPAPPAHPPGAPISSAPKAPQPLSLPPRPGASIPLSRPADSVPPPWSGTSRGNDIIRVPAVGDVDPLAGINIPALRTLLSFGKNQHPSSASALGATMNGAAAGSFGAPVSSTPAANTKDNSNSALGAGTSSTGADAVTNTPVQSTRHARRLYVGNLPSSTTEDQIADFFNRALVVSHGSESGEKPIVSVYINLEKRFAFIETRTVREAAAGICLDGVQFNNMLLRVRRPNDFQGSAAIGDVRPPDRFDRSILSIVPTQVSDGPNKMFIGGIPYSLTEDQVKALLQTYGTLAAFNLIKEPATGLSKGFAFFEYVDGSVSDAACDGLNGVKVGDKTLTVRRATNTVGGSGGGGGVGGGGSSSGMVGATHASGMASPSGALLSGPVKASDLIRASTCVVQLENMLTAAEVDDEEEFNDIREDIEEEAKRFGHVEEVLIPRSSDEDDIAAAVGRVYIRYSKVEEAERAQIVLSGRTFAERTVLASFFDESRFASRQLM